MPLNDWQTLLNSLDVQGHPQPATTADLDLFETERGTRLPVGYREYCRVFGPGVLTNPWNYRIVVPGDSQLPDHLELRQLNEEAWEANSEYEEYSSDPVLLRRALFFATDIGTSWYFWDPDEVTNEPLHEYAIYISYRDHRIERLADTFWELVNDVCLGSGIPGYDNSYPDERIFIPMGY